MARRSPPRKLQPDAPDIPVDLASSPSALQSGDRWDEASMDNGIVIPATVVDFEVRASRWIGGELSGRRFRGLRALDVHFHHCDFSSTVFDDAAFRRVAFTDCRLTGTVFSGAELRDVRISNSRADLTSFRMTTAAHLLVADSSLRGADFYELAGEDCAFLGCDLQEASFSASRLRRTRLHGSTLDGIQGAEFLRDSEISADQVAALGIALLASMNIRVTD